MKTGSLTRTASFLTALLFDGSVTPSPKIGPRNAEQIYFFASDGASMNCYQEPCVYCCLKCLVRTAVQRDAQTSPTVMEVTTVMSSPVTNYPSLQPLNLTHECFRCIGFMRLINIYALGSSLNTSRKDFISLFGCFKDCIEKSQRKVL